MVWYVSTILGNFCFVFLLRMGCYCRYPELWILWYPAHRYHAVPEPGFKPTTLWLSVRHPSHSATKLHQFMQWQNLLFTRLSFVLNFG
jgi:hypothetical protein